MSFIPFEKKPVAEGRFALVASNRAFNARCSPTPGTRSIGLRQRVSLMRKIGIGFCFLLVLKSQVLYAHVKGQRDMIVLLPSGPIHIQMIVTDGKHSLEELRNEYLDALIAKLDVNRDGQLSKDETANCALFMTGRRFDNTELGKNLPPAKGMSKSAVGLSIERAIGQSMVFRQVGTVADQDLQVFKVLDEDSSGLVERIEMRTAPARLAQRDTDHDHCVTFDEFIATITDGMPDPNLPMATEGPPPPVHSELLRDAREPVMASRLIRRYDADKDGKLSANEIGWDAERLIELDINRDGVLAVNELSKLADSQPDLSISIQLASADQPTSSVQMVSSRRPDKTKQNSQSSIELRLPSTSLSLTYRQHDPVEEAMRNARETFNAIDLDNNGYMDREEISTHTRFQRYLFDAMDIDHDDRVFSKEMDEYVRGFAEPSATTCQVTLFDSGNGYFQMLDVNSDGRISIRELRNAETQLMSLADNRTQAINPSALSRYFRIEVQRGGPMLFGPVNTINRPRPEIPQALFQQPTGPVWFQRMDRNGDGDLVWDEFLGPREVFLRLDTDHDDLIDAKEAEAAM